MDGSSQREAARRQSPRTGGQGVCRFASVRSGKDGRHAGDQYGLHESRRGPSAKARDSCALGPTPRFSSLAVLVLASASFCPPWVAIPLSTVVKRAPTRSCCVFLPHLGQDSEISFVVLNRVQRCSRRRRSPRRSTTQVRLNDVSP